MVRRQGRKRLGLDPWPLGLVGINSVWVFQVRGVGLLAPCLASGRAAAAAAYYRGKHFITVSAPHQPEGLWCIPSCLAGMFVERIKAFKELDVFSDFYLCGFVDLCKDLVVLYLSWRELVNNPCLRFQPFKFDSLA